MPPTLRLVGADSLAPADPATPTSDSRLDTGPVPPGGRSYVVQRGDTLSSIARKMLGSDSQSNVNRILRANITRLPSADRLAVGMTLAIP